MFVVHLVFLILSLATIVESTESNCPATQQCCHDVQETTALMAAEQKMLQEDAATLRGQNNQIISSTNIILSEVRHLTSRQISMCKQQEFELRGQALITGPAHYMPDSALSASSSWGNNVNHGPRCSRLLIPTTAGCYSQSWEAHKDDKSAWIQVDLGSTYQVHSIATQGRGNKLEYVTNYKLASFDGSKSTFYGSGGKTLTFAGNVDQHSVVRHHLSPPLVARRVRIYPTSFYGGQSLRWELYGYLPFC